MPADLRQDATLDASSRLSDVLGFERAVCFAPFSYQVTSLGLDANQWLQNTIRQRSELVGFGTLNPDLDPVPQVRQIAGLGFRGIKLHPQAQKFEIFGSWARRAYEAMEGLGLIADFPYINSLRSNGISKPFAP